MISPWLAMGLVMSILVGLIHSLGKLQQRLQNPELIRKILHVVMGLITLSFPWVFKDAWPVVSLSIISSVFIAALKSSKLKEWQSVICANGRQSIGEICFPLAVGLTFLLARGDVLLYTIPIAILTFADAASAIVGQRLGNKTYGTNDGTKSIEGSCAFAMVAFVCTYLSIAFAIPGPSGQITAVCVALILAILSMMFEAIAWKGLDNLFIPLGAFLVLKTHLHLPATQVVINFMILLVVSAAIITLRRFSTLNGSGLIASALFSYYALSVGGPMWALMPITLFLFYRYLLPTRFQKIENIHSVIGVLSVSSVAVLWLLLANLQNNQIYLFPYALTFAAHAAIISIAHMRCTGFSRLKLLAIMHAVIKAWCLICLPLALLQPTVQLMVLTIFLAPICIGIPTVLFYFANSSHLRPRNRSSRWVKQTVFAALAASLGLIPLLLL